MINYNQSQLPQVNNAMSGSQDMLNQQPPNSSVSAFQINSTPVAQDQIQNSETGSSSVFPGFGGLGGLGGNSGTGLFKGENPF